MQTKAASGLNLFAQYLKLNVETFDHMVINIYFIVLC